MSGAGGALLRLSQGSFGSAIASRNAQNRVLAMDLEGFFSGVVLVYFRADEEREVRLSPRHTILDVVGVAPGGRRKAAPAAELGFLGEMRRLIRERRVAAISANDPHLSGLNAWLLSCLTRVPYVIELVSDYDLSYRAAGKRPMPYLPSRRVEKLVERLVLRQAGAVYAWNRHYLECARRSGARQDRCALVRGVTDGFYYTALPVRPLADYLDARGRRIMLAVGRLSGEKYPLDLVECLARVRAEGEDVVLAIAGEGELWLEVERRAAELGVADALFLLGSRPAQDLVDLMHHADVLLATHAGYALIEEALSGTPIVAYDYEWHPELVRHEETGLLAPYRDPRALASGAIRLLRDPALGRRLAASARVFALEHHHPTGALQDEKAIYERLLRAPAGPPA